MDFEREPQVDGTPTGIGSQDGDAVHRHTKGFAQDGTRDTDGACWVQMSFWIAPSSSWILRGERDPVFRLNVHYSEKKATTAIFPQV